MTPSPRTSIVAGVDGCRQGRWLAVLWDGEPDTAPQAHLCANFGEVLRLPGNPRIIAVDIPIGLPERCARGGRAPDTAVRSRLGPRRSSVFPPPARAALAETDYPRACAVNRRHSDPPRSVSRQCFHIFPRIREVDAVLTPDHQDRVFEAHPELAFWAMNGSRPLDHPKKAKPGLALRERLLAAAGFPYRSLRRVPWPAGLVAADDVLDACALAWSARRIRDGEHLRLPPDPPRDARGLRMEINA